MSELRKDEKPELDRGMSSLEKRLQIRLIETRDEIEQLKKKNAKAELKGWKAGYERMRQVAKSIIKETP